MPTGNEIFYDVIAKNRYYVDKTPYLKTVFSEEIPTDGKTFVDGSSVLLFTRPRRFGKTLLMDMFETFLKVDSNNPGDTTLHNQLFHETKITEDKAFCEKYMGKFPVIFITLKNVFGNNFNIAYSKLAEVVASKALEFSFLKDSPALDDKEKAKFDLLSDEIFLKKYDEAQSYTTSAIKSLSSMLYKHFGQPVYILIDEYDVPLAKAQENGYHKEMVNLISSFLDFLKTPPKDPEKGNSIIGKVIMTGCLKVAKNSIFTGVNNLVVNTVVSDNEAFTGIIGFTKDETLKALKDYEMDEYAKLVKDNYDGYRFCDKEMFCPWDVINFIDENYINNFNGHKELVHANNYRANTTSSSAVYEY
ncbi:MAG: AAA family ATPase [Succinatimonas sp.]|nr:AAA family ATPase [Succinatimonas sp.]